MKLYNTLTKNKEEFKAIDSDMVKMYSCGPTVYNYFHIGNARPFIIFDMLRRYLEYKGYTVCFVQNFTDIDDKVIRKANEEGVPFTDIADRYINEYFKDAKGLGIKSATHHPRATDVMDDIISIINSLVNNGNAYVLDGDVYFRTSSFKDYGKLSKHSLEDLEAGSRVTIDERKENPLDFALWKNAKPDEPSFKSPWGMGRPGWHIECSAMVKKYLGDTIDIHSGGQDLIFPHHENEIAQSECSNNCVLSRFWLHNGFLNIDNEKMAKSKGNFFLVRDVAEVYGYQTIRMFMLSAHYRSPLNYSEESLKQAKSALERIYEVIRNIDFAIEKSASNNISGSNVADIYRTRFLEKMDDDLNTADAISIIFELVRDINMAIKANDYGNLVPLRNVLTELCDILGIECESVHNILDTEIEELISKRNLFRENKNYAESDKIRDYLLEKGIVLKDTPHGVQWSYK